MLASQRAFRAHALSPAGCQGVRVSTARPARLSVYARESRIGSKPIPVPKGVTVTIDGQVVKVKVRSSAQKRAA
jgi:hypothetical protein